MAETSMDDVLSDKEPEKTEEPESKDEVSTEDLKYTNKRKEHRKREYAAQGRDPETGQFAPKEKEEIETKEPEVKEVKEPVKEEVKEAPKEELTAKERALLAAAHDERTKRQDLERRLAAMEARGPAKEEPKTFWDDPEGHLSKDKQERQQELLNVRLSTAEMIARTKYQDFDQETAVFGEMLRTTPGLHQQWLQASDPAEFAYRAGKFTRELREAGGLPQLREKIERETRTKVEAEWKAKEEARLKETERLRRELPGSLSDVRGTTQNRVEWTGPTPLDSILAK